VYYTFLNQLKINFLVPIMQTVFDKLNHTIPVFTRLFYRNILVLKKWLYFKPKLKATNKHVTL